MEIGICFKNTDTIPLNCWACTLQGNGVAAQSRRSSSSINHVFDTISHRYDTYRYSLSLIRADEVQSLVDVSRTLSLVRLDLPLPSAINSIKSTAFNDECVASSLSLSLKPDNTGSEHGRWAGTHTPLLQCVQ